MSCPDCQDTGRVYVLSRDPATGEWSHRVQARCGSCDRADDADETPDTDATDLYQPDIGGSD
jgi:hypothetical protein